MSASKSRIYHRLQLAAHRLQKSADRAVLAAADITTAQAAVLLLVGSGRAVTQREVAVQLGLNEFAVAAMALRLIGVGLLERVRDAADARAWRLSLSDYGRTALKRIEQPFKRINQTIETVLDKEEIMHFTDYLGRIASAFDDS